MFDQLYFEIMKLDFSEDHRAFLYFVKPKCYVEAESTHQGGTVVSVIRNLNGVPVCLKVQPGYSDKYDYIQTNDVTLFEPFDDYINDTSCFSDWWKECMEQGFNDMMKDLGMDGEQVDSCM